MPAIPVETRAQTIFDDLKSGIVVPPLDLEDPDFVIPDLDPILGDDAKPKLEWLVTGTVEGDGAFEKIMAGYRSHLDREYESGKISGDQFTKMYLELLTSALGSGMQFILSKDQVYWQSVAAQAAAQRAQIEVVQARIQAETAKMQLLTARRQAELMEAQYVQTLVGIGQVDANYELVRRQITLAEEQYDAARAQTKNTLADGLTPIQGLVAKQIEMTTEQIELVKEQVESARAQTLDTRTDSGPINGYIGKQKNLLTEQVESYKKDAAYKIAKMYADGWTVQKTIDEGLLAPTQLTNTEINEVLSQVRTGVGLTP